MVYITGDLHADMDRFYDYTKLKKGDTLIVCGDFGFIWDGGKAEKKRLQKIGKRKYNVAFVEGCHDNYDLLREYPEVNFCGGKAGHITGNLYHLKRGNVYTIEGKTYFAFGGGESDDYDERVREHKWWSEEQPSKQEVDFAVEQLNSVACKVDYILTHDAPGGLNGVVDIDADKQSYIHTFFDIVCKKCEFKMWFFGKYHMDLLIPPRYRALFRDVVNTETFKKLR